MFADINVFVKSVSNSVHVPTSGGVFASPSWSFAFFHSPAGPSRKNDVAHITLSISLVYDLSFILRYV